jgi:hypothetical protein
MVSDNQAITEGERILPRRGYAPGRPLGWIFEGCGPCCDSASLSHCALQDNLIVITLLPLVLFSSLFGFCPPQGLGIISLVFEGLMLLSFLVVFVKRIHYCLRLPELYPPHELLYESLAYGAFLILAAANIYWFVKPVTLSDPKMAGFIITYPHPQYFAAWCFAYGFYEADLVARVKKRVHLLLMEATEAGYQPDGERGPRVADMRAYVFQSYVILIILAVAIIGSLLAIFYTAYTMTTP